MEIIIKKTIDLLKTEKNDICALFKRVFSKEMTLIDFEKKFLSNTFNTSYHALLLNDNNEIVGCYSSIPQEYNYFGSQVIFALSVDTMIDEEYRGSPFTLKKLATGVYSSMQQDGISFVFGFPNDNVYLVRKKILKWEDIGKLDYYILPLNIGALKPSLKNLNFFSQILSKLFMSLPFKSKESDIFKFPIEKIADQSFLTHRYDNTYQIIKLTDKSFFVYKIHLDENIRVAYIIDVFPLAKYGIEKAVSYLYNHEHANIDLIMYVGSLSVAPKNLLKVPKKYQPKNVYMSGKILDESVVDQRIYDLNNWNVNLSNYDVR